MLGDEQNPVDVVAQQVGLDPAHVLVRLDHGDDELQAVEEAVAGCPTEALRIEQ